MRNKTGLVALIVLAVATLLMVFFVLPNVSKDKPAETPAASATDTAGDEAAATQTADGKQGRTPEAGDDAASAAPDGSAQDEAAPADDAATTTAEASPDPAAAGETAVASGEPSTAGAASADTSTDWVVPAFDLLRVEPDGSTVIAGRAEPNTKIEIRNGETVVATADVGPSGDFAAVFDQPLAAGDYQLTLEASDGKGARKTSEEVATVSVPTGAGGELLAMVSRPGEASRLITVPEGESDGTADDAATARTEAAGPAVATTGEDPAATDAASDTQAAATPAENDAAAETGADMPATAIDETPTDEAPTDAAKAQVRVAAVELEGERMFIAGNAPAGALVRIYANDRLVGEIKADAQGRYVVDGRIDLPVGRHTIRADVMSADGGKVEFRASVPFDRPEGEQVAVVAADGSASQATPLLGTAGGGAFDRLRNDAAKALALLKGLFAGGRTPTAEELAAARSATEIALKSLAEFRPGGDESAAVQDMAARASAAASAALARLQALPGDAASVGQALSGIEGDVAAALTPAVEAAGAAGEALSSAAGASIDTLAAAAGEAKRRFEALFAEGRNAGTDEIRSGRSAFEAALRALSGFAPAEGVRPDATVDRLKAWASAALARLAAVPAEADAGAWRQALAALEAMPALPSGSDATAHQGGAVATTETAGGAAATTPATGDAEQATAPDGPETVEQAPLQESKTSVIIRRGDTLWQISRRLYGKGVRYTTIYLANQDQITDPDRIIPGQVFGIPDKATETDADAEILHRRHIRGQ